MQNFGPLYDKNLIKNIGEYIPRLEHQLLQEWNEVLKEEFIFFMKYKNLSTNRLTLVDYEDGGGLCKQNRELVGATITWLYQGKELIVSYSLCRDSFYDVKEDEDEDDDEEEDDIIDPVTGLNRRVYVPSNSEDDYGHDMLECTLWVKIIYDKKTMKFNGYNCSKDVQSFLKINKFNLPQLGVIYDKGSDLTYYYSGKLENQLQNIKLKKQNIATQLLQIYTNQSLIPQDLKLISYRVLSDDILNHSIIWEGEDDEERYEQGIGQYADFMGILNDKVMVRSQLYYSEYKSTFSRFCEDIFEGLLSSVPKQKRSSALLAAIGIDLKFVPWKKVLH